MRGVIGMFGTLELQQETSEVVESVVERLKTLSRKHRHGLPSCSAYTTSGGN
ncbi:hypothetical protein D8674_013726 [Pyrus ussuriensis x Pyrus communis]|uniref:Uncharacterized protein n=1 Tax=Pyrus ussuriensis x Pyrus communis TaxID=2448454 RepID=A0A5N5GRS5_9ROSA|nr:hypothetical protein D8674_013726 [Pyrus ussuriensis x Pyrus communis]